MILYLLVAVGLGSLSGMASMLLYRHLSPQDRLASLSMACSAARHELQQFDGDDWCTMRHLAARAVGLSAERVRLAILPTAAAMFPVIGAALGLEAFLDTGLPVVAAAPAGLGSLASFFWLPMIGAAWATKTTLRIR